MRMVITAQQAIDELWDHCSSQVISGCYQRVYTDGVNEPWAWQIVIDSDTPGLDFLLIKYSHAITVYLHDC